MEQVRSGYIRGTGAAVNVSLGWVPDLVIVTNATDGDLMQFAQLGGGRQVIPYTSGGTTPIAAGDVIKGATSGATARVIENILDAGSFAGGDASGWIIIDLASKVGVFQTENVYVSSDAVSGLDDATITVDVVFTQKIDTAVAGVTTTSAITSYLGSAASGLAPGFTIGSVISEDAKLLHYTAFRNGPGGSQLSANSL